MDTGATVRWFKAFGQVVVHILMDQLQILNELAECLLASKVHARRKEYEKLCCMRFPPGSLACGRHSAPTFRIAHIMPRSAFANDFFPHTGMLIWLFCDLFRRPEEIPKKTAGLS